MVHCLLALLILHRIFPLDGSLLINAGIEIVSDNIVLDGVLDIE